MQGRKNSKTTEIVLPRISNPPHSHPKRSSLLSQFLSFLSMRNLFDCPNDIRQMEIEGKLKKMSNDSGKFKILKDD